MGIWDYFDHNVILTFFACILLVFALIIYPNTFFIAQYLNDRGIILTHNEETEKVHYQNRDKDIEFNINDIKEVEQCFSFIRITFNDYVNIYLSSGEKITIGCFVPAKKSY